MSSAFALVPLVLAASWPPAPPGLESPYGLTLDVSAPPAAHLAPALVAPASTPDLRLAVAPPQNGAQAPMSAEALQASHAHTATLQWWGRTLRWSTAAALVATATLGTLAAINQPTAFGDGRCITGDPVFGTYGCDRGLSTLHGSAGILSVTLYTANLVLRLAAPESKGYVSEAARPWHTALSWIALGGIVIQPALGLIAAYPQVIGKSQSVPTDPFPRNLRTAHLFIGYITTVSFVTTVIIER
jgi:hypothetical protein